MYTTSHWEVFKCFHQSPQHVDQLIIKLLHTKSILIIITNQYETTMETIYTLVSVYTFITNGVLVCILLCIIKASLSSPSLSFSFFPSLPLSLPPFLRLPFSVLIVITRHHVIQSCYYILKGWKVLKIVYYK